jgi:hypothetical protein
MDNPCNHAVDEYGICVYRCNAAVRALLPMQNCDHRNDEFAVCTYRCSVNAAYRRAFAAVSAVAAAPKRPACTLKHTTGSVMRDSAGTFLAHVCSACRDFVRFMPRRYIMRADYTIERVEFDSEVQA